ncbi:MAG: ECF transporter S component [Acutalibacteraceae bacterium]|nr:ECF transporter S component [Acutalibacteraceae bacterium]
MTNRQEQTKKIVLGAVFTALVVILQLLGSFIRFGPFAVSLVLVPIVLGAAMCGYKIGAWLGLAFGLIVLISGDAAAFYAINVPGTVITVLLKGTLCGLLAGLTYKLLEKKNRYLAVMASAVVCPIVNTGVFLIGCKLFFMSAITEWGLASGFTNAAEYMFLGLAGGNFIFELITNVILAPVVLKVISFKKNI